MYYVFDEEYEPEYIEFRNKAQVDEYVKREQAELKDTEPCSCCGKGGNYGGPERDAYIYKGKVGGVLTLDHTVKLRQEKSSKR